MFSTSPADFSQRSILIIGGSGLIGSACRRLFSQIPTRRLDCPTHSELDLLDGKALLEHVRKKEVDYLIVAAGLVGGIQINKSRPADFLNLNLRMQINAFEAAHAAGVKRMVFFASSCMYPRVCEQPMREEALLTGEPEPTSLSYAIAKLAGVQMARSFNTQYGGNRFLALIPNSTYGLNDNFDPKSGHVMSALIARFHAAKMQGLPSVTLWGSGQARREFIQSDDVARAVAFVLPLEEVPLPLNVGVGSDVSIRELAETIASVVGYTGNIEWDRSKPDGAPQKWLDSSKIHRLGWRPQISLRDGIEQTYQWYRTAHQMRETAIYG